MNCPRCNAPAAQRSGPGFVYRCRKCERHFDAKPALYILPEPEQWVTKCPRNEVCGMTPMRKK